MGEQEAQERQKAKDRAAVFNEALKVEMARKAESEEQLIRMQHEESERQWAKRYALWEKEEMARRRLLEEVYEDRAKQCEIKEQDRQRTNAEREGEAQALNDEIQRQEELDREKCMAEAVVRKRHQEELFRQMDYHQVVRHRELQQHAIEQRQAMIAEEKLQRALESEKRKQGQMAEEIFSKRAANLAKMQSGTVTAPWDK